MEGEESCEIVLPLFCVCLHVIGTPKMVAIALSMVIMVFFHMFCFPLNKKCG